MEMSWLRARLRQWLGINRNFNQIVTDCGRIDQLEERNRLAWERIVAIEQLHSEISKKRAHLDAVLIEVRQLRELLQDPKRTPVIAKTFHQYRALMEQEI
jgi:hypothetical protein